MDKICVICGENCCSRPRTKDARGRYFCLACYEQAKHRHDAKRAADSAQTAGKDEPPALSELLDGVLDRKIADPAPHSPVARAATPKQSTGSTVARLSPRAMRTIGLLVLVAIALVVVVFGDWFTSLFFLFIGFAVVNGYLIGAARIGALFGGLLAGAVIGVPLGKALEGLCTSLFHTTGIMNRMISITIWTLVCVVLVTVILQIAIKRLQAHRPGWKRYDRLAGAGAGLLEGTLLGFLLIWAVLSLEPVAAASLAQTEAGEGAARPNPVSRQIVSLADTARDSTVGRLANTINPLSDVQLLTLLSKGLIVISDPAARQVFVEHPVIVSIQQRPSVQQSLQMLSDDPQISRIIKEETASANISAILASPTLLAVLDQTGIVSDLTPLAKDIESAINEAMEHRAR